MLQPRFKGKSKIVKLENREQFEKFINPPEAVAKSKKDKKNFSEMNSTLVIFQAHWNENCIFTYPLWAEFSNKFTTDKMRFGEVDVDKNEILAKEQKVNLSGIAGQLPALILYQDGQEFLRFPPLDVSSGSYAKVNQYKSKELIKYFDLDKRYIATRGTKTD